MAGDSQHILWQQFLHHWLRDKCASYTKPFDLPPDLMAKLHTLGKINKERDFDADKVIEILGQISAEYTALVSQSQKVVDKVSRPFADVKKTGKFEPVSPSISNQLESKIATLSDIDKKLENIELSRVKFRLIKECSSFKRKTADCHVKIEKLERELEKARNEIDEKKKKLFQDEEEIDAEIARTDFILQELQEKLNRMEPREDIYPQVLVQEMENLNNLKEKEKELMADIAKYKDLPPNILEARKVLRQAKLEEAKLNERIRKFHEGP